MSSNSINKTLPLVILWKGLTSSAADGSGTSQHLISFLHRILEWFMLEGTVKSTLFHPS